MDGAGGGEDGARDPVRRSQSRYILRAHCTPLYSKGCAHARDSDL